MLSFVQNIPNGMISPDRTLTSSQDRAWRGFLDSGTVLTEVLNRELQARHDLSLSQYRVLELLIAAPDNCLRMSDLADGVLSSRSKLTHQVGRMEQLGLVHRSACDSDARGVIAHLTDRGARWFDKAQVTYANAVRQYFIEALSGDQLKILESIFEQVTGALERPAVHAVRQLAS